jgi:putative redox protein
MDIVVRTEGGLRMDATDGMHRSVMDEPVEMGGTGEGLTPMKTLLAALGGCTAVTLKLYSARKGWPLEDVEVRVHLVNPDRSAADQTKVFTQEVVLTGDLDDAQRERLHQIAGRCPVHRVLEGPIAFEERLVQEV